MINNALNSSDWKQEELGVSDTETSQNSFSNANGAFGSWHPRKEEEIPSTMLSPLKSTLHLNNVFGVE